MFGLDVNDICKCSDLMQMIYEIVVHEEEIDDGEEETP
jgi:hypothetical protein